ncbi:MAG: RagB/SusD family nutrient uptake outer membrane protein [Gemmatimonadaceae bacterium]
MTRRLIAPLAALVLGGAAGCVDLTEHPVTGLTSAYYNTPIGFDLAVNASYQPMRNWLPLERGATMTVFGTDEYTKGADGSYKFFNDYTAQLNGDVDFIRDTWYDFYKGINTANTVIAAAPTADVPDATKAVRVGEAKFLRALYYFWLVRTYGDIPIYTDPITEPKTETNREPVAKVYDLIISDLLAAEAALPDKAAQFGRADKPAVQHLLGEVYLTRAGAATSSPDFALAAAKLSAVANNSRFKLVPRYSDLWRIDNEANSEVVFSIQFTSDPLTTGSGNKLHLYWTPAYDLEPGMLRDIANDRPFRRWRQTKWLLALWDRTKDSRYEDMHKVVWISNNPNNIPKDAAGKPKFTVGDTALYMPGLATIPAALRAATRYKLYGEDEYTDAMFPNLSKYLDPTRTSTNQEEGQRDHPIFRLANTYLMLAEALIRDGKVNEGLVWLNRVRTRAAKPGFEAAMQVTAADLSTSKSGTDPIEFILDERARELTGETTRWFDLKRTGRLVGPLSRVKKWNPQGGPNIQDYHALRPLPNVEVLNSTGNMKQNPGY